MTPTPNPDADALAHSRAITYLLLGMTVLFALILIAIDKLFPSEGQVFQVIANLTSGFAGAFMTRIQAPVRAQPNTANGASVPTLPAPVNAAAAAGAIPTPAPPSPTSSTPFPKPLGMQP